MRLCKKKYITIIMSMMMFFAQIGQSHADAGSMLKQIVSSGGAWLNSGSIARTVVGGFQTAAGMKFFRLGLTPAQIGLIVGTVLVGGAITSLQNSWFNWLNLHPGTTGSNGKMQTPEANGVSAFDTPAVQSGRGSLPCVGHGCGTNDINIDVGSYSNQADAKAAAQGSIGSSGNERSTSAITTASIVSGIYTIYLEMSWYWVYSPSKVHNYYAYWAKVTATGVSCTASVPQTNRDSTAPEIATAITGDLNGTDENKKSAARLLYEQIEKLAQEELEAKAAGREGTAEGAEAVDILKQMLVAGMPDATKTTITTTETTNGENVTTDQTTNLQSMTDQIIAAEKAAHTITINPAFTGAGTWAAWPTAPTIASAFSTFMTNIKTTSFWSLPNSMSTNFPGGGSSTFSFNGGIFGQHTYDFASWGSGVFNAIKGVILVICSWVAIKIATKGGGG